MSYHVYFIPENSSQIRKYRLTPKAMRWTAIGVAAGVFLLVFNVIGFWHYRSLHGSLEKDHEIAKAYEKERADLLNKVALLENTVGETEQMAGKLAALVGTERISLQKGIGPIAPPPQGGASHVSGALSKAAPVDLAALKALDPKMETIEDRATTLQEKIKDLTKIQEDKLNFLAATPSLWPVKGWVTSDFGYRRSPFTFAADFHDGIDIAAAWGTPIMAPADGVVTFAGYKGGYGKMVVIDHGFGVITRYGHTSEMFVKEGEKIKRGAKIALVGNTGHSTGPHLHYEIQSDGVPVDPMKYILK